MKYDQLNNKNGSYANSSPQTKDSVNLPSADLNMKPTNDIPIIKERGSDSQQNVALESPKAIESLTLEDSESLKTINVSESKARPSYIKPWKGNVSIDSRTFQSKPPKSDVGAIINRIGGTDRQREFDIEKLIEAVRSGLTWCPSIFSGHRDKEHFIEMSAIGLDFDNLTKEEFKAGKKPRSNYLEQIKERAASLNLKYSLIYETFSSRILDPDLTKYRFIIGLRTPISDYAEAKELLVALIDSFKDLGIDTGCSDPTRIFYGTTPTAFVEADPFDTIGKRSIDRIISEHRAKEAEATKAKKTKKNQRVISTRNSEVISTRNSEVIENNSNKTEWSKKPHPPFDEYGDLIYVKSERQDLILTDSLDSLNYEDLCELLKVKTALELLTEDDVTNYDTWTRVIRAVKSVILEYPELDLHLRNLVDTWSATAANYDPQAFIDKWESLTADVGISIVDLFTLAQRALDNEPGNLTFGHIFDDKYPWYQENKHATEQKHKESIPKWKKYGVAISTKVKSYFDEEIINKGAKYNLHTENIEMGDRKFSLEELFFHICEELNSNIPDNIFRKCIDLFLSDESKQFHPFDDYIKSLAPASNKVITEERIEWAKSVISEKLMQEVLSLDATDDRFDIYQDLITTWLAGFTDRSLNPGCKFDHVLVLYGAQSIGKTTFFQSLVSPDYFLSHAGSVTDKDSKMAFGRNKLIEMGEISSTFRKSDQETLKNYITTQIDQYRVPYSAKVQSFPRRFALCASTNDEHFLSDATGNRRYFVIPVEQRINVDKVPEILDDLYTAVQVLMQAGVARSYLSPIQLERLNKVNRDYTDLYEGDLLEEVLNGNKGYRDFDPNSFSINDLLRVIHEYHPHASRNPIK